MGQICPTVFLHFMTFFLRLQTKVALQCSSDSFPHMVIYILSVDNCQNYILTHSCLPIAGRLFYNGKNCMDPGSESAKNFMAMIILSASVERFSMSCMRNFSSSFGQSGQTSRWRVCYQGGYPV